jgi:hypothetical protein
MIFNEHLKLANTHAFLSASKPHWINYTDEKLDARFTTALAAQRGTELHAFAHDAIRLRIKQADNGTTLSQYVNDAIGFRMTPEQVLFYSYNCYGTADAISFRAAMLRIHDLKNGVVISSMNQLYVYAALFCLEYGIKPFEIETELRIYQNDDVKVETADPDTVTHIMDKIKTSDRRIEELRREALA